MEVVFEKVSYTYPEADTSVFNAFSMSVPAGVTSLIGQNGTGKSTFLLLAAGRLIPQAGRILLCGEDTKNIGDESEKNRFASFVYQNMEFETEEPLGKLLEFVYENGFHEKKDQGFLSALIEAFELKSILAKKTQEMSKGELQRAIMGFSLLYGSRTIMMDEPVFALENRQKERSLEFIINFSRQTRTPVLYSLHELDLSRTYSDNILFFYKNGTHLLGRTEDLFKREKLEAVYEVPYGLLHSNESLVRERLLAIAELAKRAEKEKALGVSSPGDTYPRDDTP